MSLSGPSGSASSPYANAQSRVATTALERKAGATRFVVSVLGREAVTVSGPMRTPRFTHPLTFLFAHGLTMVSLLGFGLMRGQANAAGNETGSTQSRYVAWMTGDLATDTTAARGTACRETEESGIVLISFGKQVEGGTRSFEDADTLFTYAHLRDVALAYAEGLRECRGGAWTLTVATSNYKLEDPVRASEYGSAWQRMLVELTGRAPADVAIVGGIDLEPGWGSVTAAHAWVSAYTAGPVPLVANASADGCPTRGVGGRCANGWTVEDLATMVWEDPTGTALPQIYRTDHAMAQQWGVLARTWLRRGGTPRFAGVMTQVRACEWVGIRRCAGLDLAPEAARTALQALLPEGIEVPTATDVGWD